MFKRVPCKPIRKHRIRTNINVLLCAYDTRAARKKNSWTRQISGNMRCLPAFELTRGDDEKKCINTTRTTWNNNALNLSRYVYTNISPPPTTSIVVYGSLYYEFCPPPGPYIGYITYHGEVSHLPVAVRCITCDEYIKNIYVFRFLSPYIYKRVEYKRNRRRYKNMRRFRRDSILFIIAETISDHYEIHWQNINTISYVVGCTFLNGVYVSV